MGDDGAANEGVGDDVSDELSVSASFLLTTGAGVCGTRGIGLL